MFLRVHAEGPRWTQVLRLNDDGSTVQLDDKLQRVKFSSLVWTHDNHGFFYNR